jgi:hypothetical protein
MKRRIGDLMAVNVFIFGGAARPLFRLGKRGVSAFTTRKSCGQNMGHDDAATK